MTTTVHVATAELPATLQQALAAVRFHRKDIGIEARPTTSIQDFGADGCRSFVVLVDLMSGRFEVQYGSWGGPNAYAGNAVDRDDTEYTIPSSGAVIRGREGGGRPVSASIIVHPGSMAPLLPPAADTTDDEQRVLYAYAALKSGPYRQECLRKVDPTVIDSMVARGMLKRASNGATSITTAGKNARDRRRSF